MQATCYIRIAEKYELIITVNITCMMVLTSVYLSVANSLPATLRRVERGDKLLKIFKTIHFLLNSSISIKPIEIWLLFNLAFPFIIIIVNILIQVMTDTSQRVMRNENDGRFWRVKRGRRSEVE